MDKVPHYSLGDNLNPCLRVPSNVESSHISSNQAASDGKSIFEFLIIFVIYYPTVKMLLNFILNIQVPLRILIQRNLETLLLNESNQSRFNSPRMRLSIHRLS